MYSPAFRTKTLRAGAASSSSPIVFSRPPRQCNFHSGVKHGPLEMPSRIPCALNTLALVYALVPLSGGATIPAPPGSAAGSMKMLGSLSPKKTFVLLAMARTASSWMSSGVMRARLASASREAW